MADSLARLGAQAARQPHGTRPPVRPAWVNLDLLFPAPDPARPLVIDGLDLTGEVPGLVSHWIRGASGLYLGVTSYRLNYIDGRDRAHEVLGQLVPEYALRPRDT